MLNASYKTKCECYDISCNPPITSSIPTLTYAHMQIDNMITQLSEVLYLRTML